jgi:hypothetical protein
LVTLLSNESVKMQVTSEKTILLDSKEILKEIEERGLE